MCTAIYAGSEVTVDGSVMIARCEDDGIDRYPVLKLSLGHENKPSIYQSRKRSGSTDFQFPLPQRSFSMLHVPNWPHGKQSIRSSVGINEKGVIVSATQTIFASDAAQKADPYTCDGMTEDDLTNLLLESCSDADGAVELLGKAIEEKGAAEGMNAFIADRHAQWCFETGSGHRWMARQLPTDRFLAYANQGRLTHYDKENKSYKGSADLVEFAQRNGLYHPNVESFNFSRSYSRNDFRDANYNTPRVEEIERVIGARSDLSPIDDIFKTPKNKISLSDIRSLMRNYYEGTEHDPYGRGLRGDEKWRPISIFRTTSAHILRIRPWLPEEIGEMFYLAFGMPLGSIYLPVYKGLTEIPKEFTFSPPKADCASAYWKFRKLQTLAMNHFELFGKAVISRVGTFEDDLERKENAFEDAYLLAYKNGATQKANQLLNTFCAQVYAEALNLVETLTNEIFDELMLHTNKKIEMLNGLNRD